MIVERRWLLRVVDLGFFLDIDDVARLRDCEGQGAVAPLEMGLHVGKGVLGHVLGWGCGIGIAFEAQGDPEFLGLRVCHGRLLAVLLG